jgi:hypothetical protein
MTRAIFGVALVAAVVAPLAAQGSHPSFAGTWVLDASKTVDNIGAPLPDSIRRTIVQHGDTLIVDTDVSSSATGAQHTHMVWGLDGKPWHNTLAVAGTIADVSSTLAWQDSVLVITSSLSVMGTDVTQVDRWTVSPDGKSATAVRALSQGGNDLGTVTFVFNKRP